MLLFWTVLFLFFFFTKIQDHRKNLSCWPLLLLYQPIKGTQNSCWHHQSRHLVTDKDSWASQRLRKLPAESVNVTAVSFLYVLLTCFFRVYTAKQTVGQSFINFLLIFFYSLGINSCCCSCSSSWFWSGVSIWNTRGLWWSLCRDTCWWFRSWQCCSCGCWCFGSGWIDLLQCGIHGRKNNWRRFGVIGNAGTVDIQVKLTFTVHFIPTHILSTFTSSTLLNSLVSVTNKIHIHSLAVTVITTLHKRVGNASLSPVISWSPATAEPAIKSWSTLTESKLAERVQGTPSEADSSNIIIVAIIIPWSILMHVQQLFVLPIPVINTHSCNAACST